MYFYLSIYFRIFNRYTIFITMRPFKIYTNFLMESYKTSPISKFKDQKDVFTRESGMASESEVMEKIIDELLQNETFNFELLTKMCKMIEEVSSESFPSNISSEKVTAILRKFYETQEESLEMCLIQIIVGFSYFEEYIPILIQEEFHTFIFQKINTQSSSSYNGLKVLANICEFLEDPIITLRMICSILPNIGCFPDFSIFDYWLQFLLNYIKSETSTEEEIQLIIDTLSIFLTHFDNFDEANGPFSILSCFSYIRLFWIMIQIISYPQEFDIDYIINHSLFKRKRAFLYYEFDDNLPTAFLTLAGSLISKKMNAFDIHIDDLAPLFRSTNSVILSASIWLITKMIESDREFVEELERFNFSIFREAYNSIFSVKEEIAYLYQSFLDALYPNEFYSFFQYNSDLLIEFFDLDNNDINIHQIQFFYDLLNNLTADPEKQQEVIKFLNDKDFIGIMNELIDKNEDEIITAQLHQLLDFFTP
ncbi:hypothetical protein TRFO_27861 [Tritrichomonas foetus]|uniref:Ras-GAP domain-containing protein n=1 Tax=Tritrichomonas foetus TaxID=1144522 RepID=A0A1J4K4B2_9EUKA|nr:hypothetical protein TRFO_27861 [Tritrichomonas foetus]|eukprot:OHT04596.1 hypothetical protein TRFO_27861 [Tritrichomonas foetus]